MPAAAAPWIAAGLATASTAASYIGSRQAANAQEDAAREAAQAYNIPFWGPGEQIVQKAAKFLAEKYSGAPIDAMPSFQALVAGPMGDTVAPVTKGAITPLARPAFQASRADFDVGAKKFNATTGQRYGELASDALVAQQGAKTQFHNWGNQGYIGVLQSTPPAPDPAEYLVPTASALARIGYDWYQDRHAQNLNNGAAAVAEQGGDYAITPWRGP